MGVGFRSASLGAIEGSSGRIVVVGPDRPCVLCWDHINPVRLREEAMTAEEPTIVGDLSGSPGPVDAVVTRLCDVRLRFGDVSATTTSVKPAAGDGNGGGEWRSRAAHVLSVPSGTPDRRDSSHSDQECRARSASSLRITAGS